MQELIRVVENEPRVSHRVVAENTKRKAQNIKELIDDNKSDFEEFGAIRFETEMLKAGRGQTKKITYYLNEQQVALLMTYLRNNEVVRKFKKSLVKAFFELRDAQEKNIKHIAGGYKSQLSQKNKKIKELEAKLLLLESEADKVDYRLKAKALYPIILNRIEKIEAEFNKEFAGQSLQVYKNLLEEIVKLLSREARVSRFMTFFGNGSAVNNEVIEDDRRTLTFGK